MRVIGQCLRGLQEIFDRIRQENTFKKGKHYDDIWSDCFNDAESSGSKSVSDKWVCKTTLFQGGNTEGKI